MTKIKTDHIRALEDGNFDVFSATVYIRGFVRTYATLLKLELPPVMAALDADLAKSEKFRETSSRIGEPRGWIDWMMLQLSKPHVRILLPVLVIIALVVLGVWILRNWETKPARDPLAGVGPGLYQAPTNSATQTLPLPTNIPAPRR